MAFTNLVAAPYVNLLQYCAGDGVTDDTAGITSALSTLSTTNGGNVLVPAGKTFLTSGNDLSSFAGYLTFSGGGKFKLKNSSNNFILFSTSGSLTDVIISGVNFDCNNANQTGASGGIYLYKPRRCIIEKCEILNPWQAGIYLIGASGDFGFQNHVHHNWIHGGNTTTSGVNAYGEGLRLENCDENSIEFNHFENNGNPNDGTYGFHIYDKNGLNVYTGNSFVNGKGVIKLDGLQNRIIGNVFDGNGGASIQCNGSASGTIIEGNTFLNVGYIASGGSANTINAIYLNATQCQVQGNWFQASSGSTDFTNSFVNVDTGATYSEASHNIFNVPANSGTVTPISFVSGVPTGFRHRFNDGYDSTNTKQIEVTENYGLATIANGQTSIVVSHGLSYTPSLNQISVTPQKTLTNAAFFWIDTVTSSQFTIHTNANPDANVDFSWQANVGY
jgi:hypothetical protein